MIDFRTLKVWEKAHHLVLHIYRVTNSFPREELYGLTSQIRRAALSIPSNLAEGCGRHSQAELATFSQIAMGSASELEYQLLLAHELNYLTDNDYQSIQAELNEIKRMLNSFIRKVRSNNRSGQPAAKLDDLTSNRPE